MHHKENSFDLLDHDFTDPVNVTENLLRAAVMILARFQVTAPWNLDLSTTILEYYQLGY